MSNAFASEQVGYGVRSNFDGTAIDLTITELYTPTNT
jgi:hypothetical protein